MARPKISSAIPLEYTSAESNIVRPASRQMSTRRVASATSVVPQALKNSSPPPKVPVPRLSTGTLNPEPPNCRNSMVTFLFFYDHNSGRNRIYRKYGRRQRGWSNRELSLALPHQRRVHCRQADNGGFFHAHGQGTVAGAGQYC